MLYLNHLRTQKKTVWLPRIQQLLGNVDIAALQSPTDRGKKRVGCPVPRIQHLRAMWTLPIPYRLRKKNVGTAQDTTAAGQFRHFCPPVPNWLKKTKKTLWLLRIQQLLGNVDIAGCCPLIPDWPRKKTYGLPSAQCQGYKKLPAMWTLLCLNSIPHRLGKNVGAAQDTILQLLGKSDIVARQSHNWLRKKRSDCSSCRASLAPTYPVYYSNDLEIKQLGPLAIRYNSYWP